MKFFADIQIMPQEEVFDPEGHTILSHLPGIDINGVEKVRIGKHIEMVFEAKSEEEAQELVQTACEKLLANIIMETFSFTLQPFVEESVE